MFAFWSRRAFWDWAEFVFAGLTALTGASATSLAAFPSVPANWRVASVSATFLFASATAACKWRAKVLDDQEKAAKANEIQALRNQAATQTRRSIRRLLEGLRIEFFRVGEEDTPRATLFVCREGQVAPGLGNYLCIYVRAGVYPDSDRIWTLDENELTGCRGLAGQVWFRGMTDSRTAKCDWPTDGNPAQKEEYAASLGMTVGEAETLNVKSRTFVATPIVVNGAKWGVLVLDCRKSILIRQSENSTQRQLLHLSVAAISGILMEEEP